jgi:BASS family bile acid:Na+ symporter
LLFPVWAILLSIVALMFPHHFAFLKPAIVPLLSLIMFGMGMTLTLDDFKRVAKRPAAVFVGVMLQFGIMPFAAYMISVVLDLNEAIFIGMILVGTAPGGVASNVICYLAKADVPLSVTLTMVSTLLSIIAMPLITWLLLKHEVPVDRWKILWDVFRMVFAPVVLGVIINHYFGRRLQKLKYWLPLVSTIGIVLIVAIIVGFVVTKYQGRIDLVLEVGSVVFAAVVLHNSIGLGMGYTLARLSGFDVAVARTLAIEVGMQNSGMSVAIAGTQFAAHYLATLPGAIFSVWHNIAGSILAALWRLRKK